MKIPITKRAEILSLAKHSNLSQREIANLYNVSRKTVSLILKRYRETGQVRNNRKGRSGRKSKIDQEARQLLFEESFRDPSKTSIDLKRFLATKGFNIAARTIRHHLFISGRKARRPIKKQLLTQRMKEKRLVWAQLLQSWTKEDWRRVMFSDETMFTCEGKQARYVRRSRNESISEHHMVQRTKTAAKRMYWGCMTYHGVGPITPIQGTMDANKYIPIIKDKVVPEMNETFPDGDGTFQQDLAPCHRAKKVQRVFRNNGVVVLDWPGNSPDLNPMENLWAIIKQKKQKEDCSNLEKMNQVVLNIWFDDPALTNICKNLVDSMPQRIQQVIANEGGHIRY